MTNLIYIDNLVNFYCLIKSNKAVKLKKSKDNDYFEVYSLGNKLIGRFNLLGIKIRSFCYITKYRCKININKLSELTKLYQRDYLISVIIKRNKIKFISYDNLGNIVNKVVIHPFSFNF